MKKIPFTVRIPSYDGDKSTPVEIEVPVTWDKDLEDWVFTPEAYTQIDEVMRRHMGLLCPAQLKELRSAHGFSQKEMSELLQIGEKSWSRWENGAQSPSRCVNLLIRAFYDGKLTVPYLKSVHSTPPKLNCFKTPHKSVRHLALHMERSQANLSVHSFVTHSRPREGHHTLNMRTLYDFSSFSEEEFANR